MDSSVTLSLSYYKIVIDGTTMLEIDKLNGVYIVNGKGICRKMPEYVLRRSCKNDGREEQGSCKTGKSGGFSREKENSKKANNWKIIKLSKPLEHLGSQVAELDLTGLDDLTLNDLNELYNTYELMGGGGTVMQETSLLFAELVAQRLTRLPLETLGTMS